MHIPDRDDVPERLLYPPREVERLLSVSHAQLYRLIGDGRLSAVKIGSRSFIPRASIEAFLAGLPPVKVGDQSAGRAA